MKTLIFVVLILVCMHSQQSGASTYGGHRYALIGTTVKLDANFTDKVHDIEWSLKKNIIKESDRISISIQETGSTLEIKDAKVTDSGRYQVVAKTDKLPLQQTFNLQVGYTPLKPTLRILDVGDDFIYVSIKEFNENSGNIISYTVLDLHDKDANDTQKLILPRYKMAYEKQLVKDLNFNHNYNVEVYFVNPFGKSESAMKTVFMTDRQDFDIANCRENFVKYPKYCKTCVDGFAKDGVRCSECLVVNCKTCSNVLTHCELCRDGYFLFNGECKAFADENCAKGDEFACSFCKVGFYKTFDGRCAACQHEHCDLCFGPDEKCSFCENGYEQREDGSCEKQNYCGDTEDCDECYDEKCHRCEYGFYFNNSLCDACSNLIKNCVNCNSKMKKCVECSPDFKVAANGLSCVPKSRSNSNPTLDVNEVMDEFRNDMISQIENEFPEGIINLSYDKGESGPGPDPNVFQPKDSWGFEKLRENAVYYLEAEVQFHVSPTIYAYYLAQFRNNHDLVIKWIHRKFIGGYNYLGWALNRLIVDDKDDDKLFINVMPWELMIYVDNKPIFLKTKRRSSERTTNPDHYIMYTVGGLGEYFTPYVQSLFDTNGAIADMHMYFTKPGFPGSVAGIELRKVWYGIAIGTDKAGSNIGHELGHTLGMPDLYIPTGNTKGLSNTVKYGTPGSYYSPYRVQRMKAYSTTQEALRQTICHPTDLIDGRRIGRISVSQPYYYAANDTRDGLCKQYVGASCTPTWSDQCTQLACVCVGQHGDKSERKIATLTPGLKCGLDMVCYDKRCGSKSKMEWNGAFTVDKAECLYEYETDIIDKEILPGYRCLDNIHNACVFGREDWNEGAPFTV